MIGYAALLGLIDQTGKDILILTESFDEATLLRSRITRAEVRRLLLQMCDGLAAVPPDLRQKLVGIEWDAWALIGRCLRSSSAVQREVLWHAAESQTPATLLWLQEHRKRQPELFSYVPTVSS